MTLEYISCAAFSLATLPLGMKEAINNSQKLLNKMLYSFVIPNPTKHTGINLFSPLALHNKRVRTPTLEQSGKALKASSEISFGDESSSSCSVSG
jgi:hypothetical protein